MLRHRGIPPKSATGAYWPEHRPAGFALYQAQAGLKYRDAKPLKGLGSGIFEVVSRYDGDTYRAVYAVRFKRAVYVLHAFQKKAKRGIATPKSDIDWIKRRLKAAERHYEESYGKGSSHDRR